MALLLIGVFGCGAVAAQTAPPDLAPEVRIAEAVQKMEQDTAEAAIPLLRAVLDADAAHVDDEHGAAAYWLGRAYAETDQIDEALDAWASGIEALQAEGAFSARLADAFVEGVFGESAGRHYTLGAEVYLQLLERVDATPSEAERAIVAQHIGALAPILPPSVREHVGVESEGPVDSLALSSDAGSHLRAWWRSQDPMPATEANERVEEHLERVAYARRHYQNGDSLDDRGRTYIRFGPPYKQTTIDFNSSSFRRNVLNRNPTIPTYDFPDNEFWIYWRSEPSGHFLFIEEERDYYTVGASHDLIPSMLENGMSQSPRGQQLSRAYVRAMTEAYRQLALYHDNFSIRYMELANYADLLDTAEFTGQWPHTEQAPPTFARSMRSRIETEDEYTARLRKQQIPRTSSNLAATVDSFPVAVRTARFLDADGTTRTQVYWSAALDALIPSDDMLERINRSEPPEDYYVSIALMHKHPDYRDRSVQRRSVIVDDATADTDGLLAPQTYTVRGDTGLYHLALQWDAYEARQEDDRPLQLGRRVKFNAQRHDSLTALQSDAGQLEMSDLKPLLVTDENEALEAQLEAAPAYPFAQISADASLALYFEAYHLGFNDRGRAEYTVEYDVHRRTKRRGLTSLFRGDDEQRTATRTTHEAQDRTAQEYILIDLDEFDDPTGMLTVTVTITDEITGQAVSRTIDFEVVQGS